MRKVTDMVYLIVLPVMRFGKLLGFMMLLRDILNMVKMLDQSYTPYVHVRIVRGLDFLLWLFGSYGTIETTRYGTMLRNPEQFLDLRQSNYGRNDTWLILSSLEGYIGRASSMLLLGKNQFKVGINATWTPVFIKN
jgi:hypothetical protein